jgi:hypothetical protein
MPTLDWLNRAAAFDIAKNVPYRLLEAVSEHVSSTVRTEPVEVPFAPQGSAPSPAARERAVLRAMASTQSSLALTPSSADSNQHHTTSPHPNPLPKGEGTKPATVDVKPTHDNLLIQGDNLEALKARLPFYVLSRAGQVHLHRPAVQHQKVRSDNHGRDD